MIEPIRPPDSPGQFFIGVTLGLSLLLGSGLVLLVVLFSLLKTPILVEGATLLSGPLMILVAAFLARKQSFSYWVGVLAILVPGLLFGLWVLLLLTLAGQNR
ncbi:hypothetical protein [Anthocerotibacter panamensis]|uniref:hypothetical protein n=1 Tax=Anthocerotibacter panamensis TaxID=2857077 RepID=UPI001C402510|nr:hypothetical protein [Anthocerotibacter panamensis]